MPNNYEKRVFNQVCLLALLTYDLKGWLVRRPTFGSRPYGNIYCSVELLRKC